MKTKEDMDEMIQICAGCLTASCWHGEFMCDGARYADITSRSRRELSALGLEHESQYSTEMLVKLGIK